MRVGQKNKLTYRWARKGSRPRAVHDQRTQSSYLFGAVCPDLGTGAALVLPACNSEAMQLHLDEIATKVSAETLRVLNPATTNAVNLTGNEIANILTGNAGANALNGRTGADTMRGLAGNDSYYVDISSDKVLELLNQGSDTVRTTVSYALAAGQSVEILRVHDQATTNVLNLLGNEQVNSLMGNNGANALDGKAGADVMRGFLGNDAYYVDNAGDHVIELTNQGTDTVLTTTSFALASGMSIETLRVLDPASTNAVNLTGNQLANTVIGNNGVNVVNGGAGNDQLNAGGGNDFILFDTALSAATNVDTITAYSVAADTIRLETRCLIHCP